MIEVLDERTVRELDAWTQLVLTEEGMHPWVIGRFHVVMRFVEPDFDKRQPTLICIFDTATCASYFLHGKRGGRETSPNDVLSVIQTATEETISGWIASLGPTQDNPEAPDDLSLS